ncbi:MAG: universal stress protein UspA [Betaproteobacteria bacterium HGW-Betaproteobacteria-11]|nr:MAG: universal stress protein UspA [Betaproteobacteria bacterium HGW-Betaproteobacteria-11]
MKILLAVDGSPQTAAAVRHAIRLMRCCAGSTLTLVTVVPPADTWELKRFMKPEEIEAMQESQGGDQLSPARALLDAEGIRYTPRVLLGEIASTLVEEASRNGADLVIIGSRGHTAAASALLGSTALAVIRLAGVPVTVVRQD